MGKMDHYWAQVENRLPIDNFIILSAVIVHNILAYPVFRERQRVENQDHQFSGIVKIPHGRCQ